MFWNEKERRWQKHPDCRCQHDPCTCAFLRPLDKDGKPLHAPMWDAMQEDADPNAVTLKKDVA